MENPVWSCPSCSQTSPPGQSAGELICTKCGQLLWLEESGAAGKAKEIRVPWEAIDTTTALALQELLTDASRDVDRLLVNLSGVDLIASSGLAVFVSMQKNLRPAGKAIVLREPRPFVRKMLKTVGFDEMLGLQ
jgi:anti-anti-sigma factor